MEREKLFEQIQDSCKSLASENEEFVFISVNTQTKMSKCMVSQLGVDFLNQQLVVDSVETTFLQMFKNLVKGHYSADIEAVTEQDSVTKILLDPLSPDIKPKLDNTTDNPNDKSDQDSNSVYNLSNEIEGNKLKGSETPANEKMFDRQSREDIVCSSEKVTPRRCGRPRKEDSVTKTSKIKVKSEPLKSKTQESKTSKSHSIQRSRSGRKVSMPKWLQEDYSEVLVKEIKTEPVDELTEQMTGSRSSTPEDKKVLQKGDNLVMSLPEIERRRDESNNGIEETMNKESLSGDEGSDSNNKPPPKKTVKRKIEDTSQEDSAIEEQYKVKVARVDNSCENNEKIKVMVDSEEVEDKEFNITDESAVLNSLENEKSLAEDYDEIKEDGDDEICKEEENEDNENHTKLFGYWTCAVCQMKCNKCFLVRRHMQRMHDINSDDLRPCSKCKTVYANEVCGCSSEQKTFNCDVCGAEFYSHKSLLNHEEVHKNDEEVPCHICSKKFRSIRHVKMHVYHTHKRRNGKALTTKIDPAVCDICGKWFKFKCNALRHREIHFDEKRFKCSVCSMKFRHSSSLKRHMTSHQEKMDKMYVCEQCGQSFKLKQTLVQHHRVHVQEPFLKCEYCLKEFRTYKGKKYHILRFHPEKTGDFGWKSYDCETCGKPLSSQIEHDEHQKTHDQNRLYSCPVCSSRWETIAQMKAHLKSHSHIPFRYRCKVCNISFKAASKVRAHMLKEGHLKKCHAKGLDQSEDKVSDLSNKDIIEVLEYDFGKIIGSEEDLDREMEQTLYETTVDIGQDIPSDMQELPEEIKVIRLEQNEYDGVGTQVKILNEEGVEVLYDQISLPEEEITVEGEQVIYQVEIDGQNTIICDSLTSGGQNTIICDTLTSQAVESILKLQNQG